MLMFFFVFFKQKTAYEMRISDWSSDVCSSDLAELATIANVQCSDVEELIETIINLTSPDSDHRESFYTIYAHGGCDVFAVALQRIIGGDLYAVTDPRSEERRGGKECVRQVRSRWSPAN